MDALVVLLQGLCLVPVVVGSVYAILCLCAAIAFSFRRPKLPDGAPSSWPGVTILKPIHGMEKDLERNLRSACIQDYPNYQVVLSVQRLGDPALPLLHKLETEFGSERVSVVVATGESAANGKIHNLRHALAAARHDVLVISDSDIRLRSDYLRTIVAPLGDPAVGFACTLYRAVRARRWFERLEQLSLHDFAVNVIFAEMTGASDFCLGSSLALRRSTLEAIGGLRPFSSYLVEDFELGRRIQALGLKTALVPYTVDVVVDLSSPLEWWRHQLYWDQNTRFARPVGFLSTVLVRPVPFALLFAALRLFDPLGALVLASALAVRLATSGVILALLRDREGLRNLALLPVRDLSGLGTWLLALFKRTVFWRGAKFALTSDGRMVRHEKARAGPPSGGSPVASPLPPGANDLNSRMRLLRLLHHRRSRGLG